MSDLFTQESQVLLYSQLPS